MPSLERIVKRIYIIYYNDPLNSLQKYFPPYHFLPAASQKWWEEQIGEAIRATTHWADEWLDEDERVEWNSGEEVSIPPHQMFY